MSAFYVTFLAKNKWRIENDFAILCQIYLSFITKKCFLWSLFSQKFPYFLYSISIIRAERSAFSTYTKNIF